MTSSPADTSLVLLNEQRWHEIFLQFEHMTVNCSSFLSFFIYLLNRHCTLWNLPSRVFIRMYNSIKKIWKSYQIQNNIHRFIYKCNCCQPIPCRLDAPPHTLLACDLEREAVAAGVLMQGTVIGTKRNVLELSQNVQERERRFKTLKWRETNLSQKLIPSLLAQESPPSATLLSHTKHPVEEAITSLSRGRNEVGIDVRRQEHTCVKTQDRLFFTVTNVGHRKRDSSVIGQLCLLLIVRVRAAPEKMS